MGETLLCALRPVDWSSGKVVSFLTSRTYRLWRESRQRGSFPTLEPYWDVGMAAVTMNS